MPHKDPIKRKAYKKAYNAEHKAKKRAYYLANKEHIAQQRREHYQANRERLQVRQKLKYREKTADYLLYAAKDRAEKLGIPFNLEKGDFAISEVCPVFGTPFEVGSKDNAPSLDRIRPELGYTKGNVMIISFRANRLKNNATIRELERVLKYMKDVEGVQSASPS